MKECNECVRDCKGKTPNQVRIPCLNKQIYVSRWKITDMVSKFTITDYNNPLLKYFLKYA